MLQYYPAQVELSSFQQHCLLWPGFVKHSLLFWTTWCPFYCSWAELGSLRDLWMDTPVPEVSHSNILNCGKNSCYYIETGDPKIVSINGILKTEFVYARI
jgi:hypothetical protein